MPNTHNLHRFATFLAIPAVIYLRTGAPATAHPAISQSSQLLDRLRQMAVVSVTMQANSGRTQAKHQQEARQSAREVGEFARKARPDARHNPDQDPIIAKGDAACGNPATLFLSTGNILFNDRQGSIELTVESNQGKQSFSFASGTTMSNIIAAINSFDRETGVIATVSEQKPRWIELNSAKTGEDEFVMVKAVNSVRPIIYTDINDPQATFKEIDFGEGIRGDFNCDGMLNARDLFALIRKWGPCRGCPEDLDESGNVDVKDLILFIDLWKGVRPPRPPRPK